MEKELYTKSIVKDRDPINSVHISVMSRHTLSDGLTPDERIVEGESFDEWLKEFSPPDRLVGAYYRDEIDWDAYESSYLQYLQSSEIAEKLKKFAERCAAETITLLCIEDTPDRCHRRLLAEEIQRYQPELTIIHK